MQATVLNNQTLLDVAIHHFGTVQAVTELAILNNISVTAPLVSGTVLELPTVDYGESEVVSYFTLNNKQPATGFSDDLISEEENSGIDYWAIGDDFIVQ